MQRLLRLEPVPVDGDCSAGPPMGELGAYAATSVKLAEPESGSVRIRSCAVWPAADQRNVTGLLDAGLVVPAFGPVKHGPMSSGIGYVVPLIDSTGRTCRGHVSQTVIDRIDARGQPDVPSRPADSMSRLTALRRVGTDQTGGESG